MRLYSCTGLTVLDHPDHGTFEADDDGGFDFPDELSDQLHGFAHAGRPLWETDIERQNRLVAEELERRRDPATLMAAVQQLVKAANATREPADDDPDDKAPSKRTAKRASPPAKKNDDD